MSINFVGVDLKDCPDLDSFEMKIQPSAWSVAITLNPGQQLGVTLANGQEATRQIAKAPKDITTPKPV